MSAILYYLIILPMSWQPYFILYGWSGFTYFWLYKVFGYRKEVVMKNLRNSFPDKSEAEIKDLTKRFYKHFCDLIVESIKAFSISEKQVRQRMTCANPELPNKYAAEGRSVILVGGHYNSWELFALHAPLHLDFDVMALYKPLANKFFDRVMKKTRGKTGMLMAPMKEVNDLMAENRERPTATIFGADQSPSKVKNAYWMEFLNQDTGVMYGTELMAKRYNHVVIYGTIHKPKRGHYEVHYTLIEENPNDTPYGEITEKHTRLLESTIRQAPEFWLWTHRRWKRKRPDKLRGEEPQTAN